MHFVFISKVVSQFILKYGRKYSTCLKGYRKEKRQKSGFDGSNSCSTLKSVENNMYASIER